MLPGMCLTCIIKCFPSILVWLIQIHHNFLAMFSGMLSNNWKTVISIVFSIMLPSLSIYLRFLNMLPEICFTYRMKCSPQSWYGQSKFINISRQYSWEACQGLRILLPVHLFSMAQPSHPNMPLQTIHQWLTTPTDPWETHYRPELPYSHGALTCTNKLSLVKA